uniref:hypothetical protein n=3 Tax=Vibrionaceae TaxID=641 RepID=UPI001E40EE39
RLRYCVVHPLAGRYVSKDSILRYQWNELNKMQVGTFSEYFVKMELTMFGFEVYTTEIDDRGIDFVARLPGENFLTIQVKSIRDANYVFVRKDKFQLSETNLLALAVLKEGIAPKLYLIPSTVWNEPNSLFVSRDYEGRQSKPEWGLNLSGRTLPMLEDYEIEKTIRAFKTHNKAFKSDS